MRGQKRMVLFILGAGLAFVAWRAVAISRYREEAARLIAEAERLPREYALGQGRPLTMVVLGDSTAAGVGATRLEETLPYRVAAGMERRVTVRNLAVSGARTFQVTHVQLDRLSNDVPDVVLISISANDATHGTSPSDAQDNLKAIFDRLRGLEVGRVLVSTTPNFRTTPALPFVVNRLFERRATRLSQAIRRIAKRFPNVRIADLNGEGTLSKDQYAADGFHPNAAGYRRWASIFLRAMEGSTSRSP